MCLMWFSHLQVVPEVQVGELIVEVFVVNVPSELRMKFVESTVTYEVICRLSAFV